MIRWTEDHLPTDEFWYMIDRRPGPLMVALRRMFQLGRTVEFRQHVRVGPRCTAVKTAEEDCVRAVRRLLEEYHGKM